MAKAVKHSTVATEIKKEYLKEHLRSVRKLVETWLSEFSAPEPLTPFHDNWGWQSVYATPTEKDRDSNHMLRHHIRSRALWSHHSEWESILESVWQLINQIRKKASAKQKKLSNSTQRQYSSEFSMVALWKGFDVANGRKLDDLYKVPDDQRGISFGAYKIELSALTQGDRDSIEREHRKFIDYLAKLDDMRQLIELWGAASKLREQIQGIVSKILKSGDILYPCTFCRHLWR